MKKRLTINDIAKMAKTSKTTVSFYLNGKFEHMSEDTKDRIAKVIQETNYSPSVPARSLKINKMNLIGVLIGDITNSFANQLVKGINSSTKEHKYQFIISETNYDPIVESKYISQMIAMGVDGFIVQPTKEFHKNLSLIKAANKKIVFIDSTINEEGYLSVNANHYLAARKMADNLKSNSYDSVYILSANPEIISTRQERIKGFLDGFGEEYQGKIKQIVMDENTSQKQVDNQIANIVDQEEKALVIVINCWMLPKVYNSFSYYKSRVPHQLSLVGFDNTEWCFIAKPSVTTIVQPACDEGRAAANALIQKIEKGFDVYNGLSLNCELAYGDTTE